MNGMLAAAATLWVMFWLWLAGPRLGVGRLAERLALALLFVELAALLVYSYGNDGCATAAGACPLHAQVAGVAAHTDIPILAALLVALAFVRLYRDARAATALSDRARAAARPTAPGWAAGPRGSRR